MDKPNSIFKYAIIILIIILYTIKYRHVKVQRNLSSNAEGIRKIEEYRKYSRNGEKHLYPLLNSQRIGTIIETLADVKYHLAIENMFMNIYTYFSIVLSMISFMQNDIYCLLIAIIFFSSLTIINNISNSNYKWLLIVLENYINDYNT